MSKKLSLGVVAFAVAVIGAVGLVSNRQLIKDHYIVSTTQLSPASASLAQDIALTDSADFTYQASQPAVDDAAEFNAACKDVAHEQSIVLGCFTKQRIYIYNVTDPRLAGVKQVTAAHELLHAAYLRMSSSERTEVDALLAQTAATIKDQRFKDTLEEYRQSEPDQINNELHSIIGTEIAVLPTALEKHYQKYFKDRQKIVNYAKSYQDTFTELSDQIKSYDAQLLGLKNRKDTLENRLEGEQSSLQTESSRLQSLRSAGNTSAYNNAVPGYNELARRYNDDVAELKQIINSYNQIVDARNKLATTQNDLAQQLNSNYSPTQ